MQESANLSVKTFGTPARAGVPPIAWELYRKVNGPLESGPFRYSGRVGLGVDRNGKASANADGGGQS